MDLIVLTTILVFLRSAESTLYFTSAHAEPNPTYVTKFTVAVFNDSNGISRVNISCLPAMDFEKVVLHIELKRTADRKSDVYDNLLFKGNVDTCEFAKGGVGNFFVKYAVAQIDKFTNYKFECPLKKRMLHATNFPIMDDRFIPYALIGQASKWEMQTSIKVKVEGVDSMVLSGTLVFRGIAIPNKVTII